MDTANNRIIRYGIDRHHLVNRQEFWPSGKPTDGTSSPNYVHMNSMFHDSAGTYVVYHNYTRHTGRKSEIAILNDDLDLQGPISTEVGDAHNVYPTETSYCLCDSQGGGLIWDGQYLDCGCLTRCLAISDHVVIVGGSDWAERDERDRGTGYIFVFDAAAKALKSRITIPGAGSVYEIRLISPEDHAMSSHGEKVGRS